MTKRMLIDSTHSEETRVVIIDGNKLDDFDVETTIRKQIKGNVYLAKVIRVEPSLQAAFLDYGESRHGFLPFNEIHPDYYQIPIADKEALLNSYDDAESFEEESKTADHDPENEKNHFAEVITVASDYDDLLEIEVEKSRKHPLFKKYKIQEVIKRNQIMLIEITKEERGNKGVAMTTYLSLPGRYCVLMPNSGRGGGISRKITSSNDRKRLKNIINELPATDDMAVIVRTAGKDRNKAEITRDYDYLIKIWNTIREETLKSKAPSLIYEEGNLIKRSIRDIYTKDLDEIIVEGDNGYRIAKDFMKMITPSHARKVKQYKETEISLFQRYHVEAQLENLHNPVVQLDSGGYVVINQTEALVAIDVNSGRATKERNIEDTAFKTNMEAVDEIARQLRLRNLAGLIVIDFIDMEEIANNHLIERRIKEALKKDRAKIQIGRISGFGLMEISRQRIHSSFLESSYTVCPHCNGKGLIRSVESSAIFMLRMIEEEALRKRSSKIIMEVPVEVALYLLNYKRKNINILEQRYNLEIIVKGNSNLLLVTDYRMDREKIIDDSSAPLENLSETALPSESLKTDNNQHKLKKYKKRNFNKNKKTKPPITPLIEKTQPEQELSENKENKENEESKNNNSENNKKPYHKKSKRNGLRNLRKRYNHKVKSPKEHSNTTEIIKENQINSSLEAVNYNEEETTAPKKGGWWQKLMS